MDTGGGRVRTGDRIVVQSTRVGYPVREGEVIEVRGPGGTAPFLVRWSDGTSESLVFPGPDVVVKPRAAEPAG
ncbi:DUF1918 domain-containing protein [Georgenia sp. TF02-10]|uniref:DUF1918 domain-containing protein n=1 Tax=Georgenia sp. TF02-10 TaxID=2917725 RepID=UPI001FA78057|nr:DUF1918 domain-containing protein [Georgenia sp. TF02-10]UNX56254.1 DUF1918 domain-containing protein [Georgenia sp. TF02-10]